MALLFKSSGGLGLAAFKLNSCNTRQTPCTDIERADIEHDHEGARHGQGVILGLRRRRRNVWLTARATDAAQREVGLARAGADSLSARLRTPAFLVQLGRLVEHRLARAPVPAHSRAASGGDGRAAIGRRARRRGARGVVVGGRAGRGGDTCASATTATHQPGTPLPARTPARVRGALAPTSL